MSSLPNSYNEGIKSDRSTVMRNALLSGFNHLVNGPTLKPEQEEAKGPAVSLTHNPGIRSYHHAPVAV